MKRVFTFSMLFALAAAVTSCENERGQVLQSQIPADVIATESIVDFNGAEITLGEATGMIYGGNGVDYTFYGVATAKDYAEVVEVTDRVVEQPEIPEVPEGEEPDPNAPQLIKVPSNRYTGYPFMCSYGDIKMEFASYYTDAADYHLEGQLEVFGGFIPSYSYTGEPTSDLAAAFTAMASTDDNGMFLAAADMNGSGYTSGITDPSPAIKFSEPVYFRSFKTAISPLLAAHELVIPDDANENDGVYVQITGYIGETRVGQVKYEIMDYEGNPTITDWELCEVMWRTKVDKVVFTMSRTDITAPKYFCIDDIAVSTTSSYWTEY